MIGQLLPTRLDNSYSGSRWAPWLLGVVVAVKVAQSVVSIGMGRYVAMTADGLPLDSYSPAGAQAVVALFALLGVARLPFYALCIVVLVRYRRAVPLMLGLLGLEYVARSVALTAIPITRTGAAGGLVVNQVLFALMVVGFVLSLRQTRAADSP